MVYSYLAVQDAVPWGSSHTQYVCKEVTERSSESHFACTGPSFSSRDSNNNNFLSQPAPQIYTISSRKKDVLQLSKRVFLVLFIFLVLVIMLFYIIFYSVFFSYSHVIFCSSSLVYFRSTLVSILRQHQLIFFKSHRYWKKKEVNKYSSCSSNTEEKLGILRKTVCSVYIPASHTVTTHSHNLYKHMSKPHIL